MNICKGICVKFKATESKGGDRYAIGQKLCSKCGLFLFCNDTRCPCCKCVLRITPKSSKFRKRHGVKNFVWQ